MVSIAVSSPKLKQFLEQNCMGIVPYVDNWYGSISVWTADGTRGKVELIHLTGTEQSDMIKVQTDSLRVSSVTLKSDKEMLIELDVPGFPEDKLFITITEADGLLKVGLR